MKTLILFYSYGGNTRKIAEMIQVAIGGDLAEIKTVNAYAGDYNAVVNQGKKEIEKGFMPEIQPLDVDIASYEQVFLGSPVWWYTFAPAVKTLLSQTNFSGKTVYPFATNGGWIGHTLSDFKKDLKGAEVKEGIAIEFDGNRLKTPEAEITKWLKKVR